MSRVHGCDGQTRDRRVRETSFAAELAGRVITGLNLLVFLGAFSAQWGIGALIDLWPRTASGGYAPAGYRTALLVMFALQVVAMLWYLLATSHARRTVN